MLTPIVQAPVPPESVTFPAVVPAQTESPVVTAALALIGMSPASNTVKEKALTSATPITFNGLAKQSCVVSAVVCEHCKFHAVTVVPLRYAAPNRCRP